MFEGDGGAGGALVACLDTRAGVAGGGIWTSAAPASAGGHQDALKLLQTRVRLQGYESVGNRFKLN